MEEMAESYQGPHSIILNRNETNQGVAEHLNRIGQMMKGDFLVISAGDDISMPDRTSAIFEEWDNNRKQVDLVYSAAMEIDEQGNDLFLRDEAFVRQNLPQKDARELLRKNSFALGATCAISQRIFREFPPLMPALICEDHAWPLRARLRGGDIVYIDKPLVRHRCGGMGTRLPAGVRLLDYQQKLIDIQSQDNSKDLVKICRDYLSYWSLLTAKRNGRFREESAKYTKSRLCWIGWTWGVRVLKRKLGLRKIARRFFPSNRRRKSA